ncbi:MAG: hypothetical protein A3F68_01525 [Acidobacteria bacterium RIFCSPLOWO2_12_FULL_54_10]|nr:MAG: hypothetical protein A3F68_01525 [Acidobacteria bacterium RIFCSPLOWO2_12_FULL_54_10]
MITASQTTNHFPIFMVAQHSGGNAPLHQLSSFDCAYGVGGICSFGLFTKYFLNDFREEQWQ